MRMRAQTESELSSERIQHTGKSPRVTAMRVVPVAGRDSMLLNLSGAHGPFLRAILFC